MAAGGRGVMAAAHPGAEMAQPALAYRSGVAYGVMAKAISAGEEGAQHQRQSGVAQYQRHGAGLRIMAWRNNNLASACGEKHQQRNQRNIEMAS